MGEQLNTPVDSTPQQESCGSERMCVVCRQRKGPKELLRLGLKAGILKFDRRTEKGRSAWLCPSKVCIEGLTASTVARGLRVSKFKFPEQFNAVDYLAQRSRQVLLETLGLARRAGKLRVGMESIARAGLHDETDSFIIAANDLSERSQKLYQDRLGPWSGAELARAIGLDRVGVLGIEPSGFAIDALFWFGLLRSLSPHVDEIRG